MSADAGIITLCDANGVAGEVTDSDLCVERLSKALVTVGLSLSIELHRLPALVQQSIFEHSPPSIVQEEDSIAKAASNLSMTYAVCAISLSVCSSRTQGKDVHCVGLSSTALISLYSLLGVGDLGAEEQAVSVSLENPPKSSEGTLGYSRTSTVL